MSGATYYVLYKTDSMNRFKKYDLEDDIPAVRFHCATMIEDSDYSRMRLQEVADRHSDEGMIVSMRDQWNNIIFETE